MNSAGLTKNQVQEKIAQGKVNRTTRKNQTTIAKIIAKNTLTIFNLVNLILAIMIIVVGSYKNLLFVLIAIANTLIAIINELRAKKTIDKMRLIAEQNPTVIRDGKTLQIDQKDIVEGDLILYSLGDQILVDSRIEEGTVEVNESFITGESENIKKSIGDKLISGSFVVSGTCKATVTAVGPDNYINKLEKSAHSIKTADSKLFSIMNNIVKYISFALIPIGALLLWSRFRADPDTPTVAVTSTVAALINMIPEGLILLTSSVLALATIRLSKKQVLVQDLYSIETLARVDCIALDKTGTLTTGKMQVTDIIPVDSKGTPQNPLNPKKPTTPAEKSLLKALKLILGALEADTATSAALRQKLPRAPKNEPTEQIQGTIPFSSERKYSGIITRTTAYLMGAPEILIKDRELLKKLDSAINGQRVIAVVRNDTWAGDGAGGTPAARRHMSSTVGETATAGPAQGCKLLGYVIIKDELRKDAQSIINYFVKNDVIPVIISGDSPKTVSSIATSVDFPNPTPIDLSSVKSPDYTDLVRSYNIFTRVKPSQKKSLILALKKQGHTVAMTGDGVNDILAMKEADCSIAIGEGSDAARRSAKLVLMSSDFASVPSIIDEGRQTINNLERSTTLFLTKTIYASILAVIFVFLPFRYPFTPIEMSLLNFTCIGLPGLVLALEHNTARIKDQFIKNIKRYSVPTGIIISVVMLIVAIVAENLNLAHPDLITISAITTFVIDFILIFQISRPLNRFRFSLLVVILAIFLAAYLIPLAHAIFFAP